MSPQLQSFLTLFISIAALGCSITMAILTIKRDNKADNSGSLSKEIRIAENFKEINVKLDLNTQQLTRMMQQSENNMRQFMEINGKMERVMQQIETLFKYKDDHEIRLKKLEGRKE